MIFTISDKQIDITGVNFAIGQVTWRRIGEGYRGECVTDILGMDFGNAQEFSISAIEKELLGAE